MPTNGWPPSRRIALEYLRGGYRAIVKAVAEGTSGEEPWESTLMAKIITRTWTTTGPTGRIVKRVAHGYRERRVCAE